MNLFACFRFETVHSQGVPYLTTSRFEDGARHWVPERNCGRMLASAPSDYMRWPDILAAGDFVSLAFSEKIVGDLESAGFGIESGYVDLKFNEPPKATPPVYKYLGLPTGCEYHPATANSLNLTVRPETVLPLPLFVGKMPDGERRKPIYCNFEVVELARKRKWTNAAFRIPKGYGKHGGRQIDLKAPKKHWPPEWLVESYEF